MSVVIFLIVLSALVLVHELGHFIAAKLCNVSVREFGLGFPPKIARLFRWRETVFTLNALPFGGFVKMEGEDEEVLPSPKSFSVKHPLQKLTILVAGIVGNILFAWFLISIVLASGVQLPVDVAGTHGVTGTEQTVIVEVQKGSPAEIAGIIPGVTLQNFSPDTLHDAVVTSNGNPVVIQTVNQDNQEASYTVTPEFNTDEGVYKIGIASDQIVQARFPFFSAIGNGFLMTAHLVKQVSVGIATLIGGLFMGHADTSGVTGPVGLVGIVGGASKAGFASLLTLMAIISINLAVINIVPFPALDGGRIFVTIIEWIRGKQFNQKILGNIHSIGFMILIGLLVLVTIKDIKGLF